MEGTQVLERTDSIWIPGTVQYSQNKIHQPDGYRQDCSGYASLCWAIPLDASGSWGGLNTVNLVTNGWMYEIPFSAIQPGDAVGKCGPLTSGNDGHIQIVKSYNHATGVIEVWEQAGGTYGPLLNKYKRITPGYKAYRFGGISDAPTPPPPDMRMKRNSMFRLIDPDNVQFVISPDSLSETGWSYVQITPDLQGWMLVAAGIGTANGSNNDPNHDGHANDNWRPGAFGPSKAAARTKMIEDIANKVVSKLPTGSGGAGVTLEQIKDAVRDELDQTRIPSVPGTLEVVE